MDVYRYPELKAKGVVSIGKVGDAYIYTAKRFDPATGEETRPMEVGEIIPKQLEDHIAELEQRKVLMSDPNAVAAIEKQIAAIQELLNDIRSL